MAKDKYGPKGYKSLTRWSPNPAPVDPSQLPNYLFNELNRLGDLIFNVDMLQLSETSVAPGEETVRKTKPRDGDIRYASGNVGGDGSWNPGGTGEGIYAYFDGDWNKL